MATDQNNQMTLQAGLRTLHEAGPELKRAISGNLDEVVGETVEPMHRVSDSDIPADAIDLHIKITSPDLIS